MKDEEVPGKAYTRGYIDGLAAGIWAGTLAGILLSTLGVALYHLSGR